MMQHTKKWLSAVLAVTIAVTMALSDCAGMTVLATEDITTGGASVSENNDIISDAFTSEDETEKGDDNDIISLDPSEDTEKIETDSDTDTAAELPALHIGQIKKGEDLPSPDDNAFVYDLPVSFETSEQIVLFANYNLNALLEEENGTLVWSILRGEKEMTPGSTSLIDEDDDWTDFETVSVSPLFDVEEITDEESEYYQMMALTLAEPSSAVPNSERSAIVEASEKYDYYIRAAYYSESENEKDEAFYAAATIPFVPQDTDTEEFQEDAADTEDTQSDSISDNTISMEDTAQEELQETETADVTSDDVDAEDADFLEEDKDPEQTSESVSENSAAAEPFSTLSETEGEGDTVSQPTQEKFGVLTLDAENVTLHIDNTLKIRATLKPEDPDAEITWTSSNPDIVSVLQNTIDIENKWSRATDIKALAAGTAQITATYSDDLKATVNVQVLAEDPNEVYDLSSDIWISGFKKEDASLVYTGQKVTQDFQVYYKETLLKEKTDYTLTYKNNVNAAEWNAVKAPNVTITMKGQYQGSATLYFTINPLNINNIDRNTPDGNSPGYLQTVNYSKKLSIPTPVLTFNKKKLAVKKDFVCDYTTSGAEDLPALPSDYKNGTSYEKGTIYYYTVNGTGNFTGSFPMQLVVVDKTQNFSSATVKLNAKQYAYQGKPLTNLDVKIEEITLNKQSVKDYCDYDVYASGIDGAYIMVYPNAAGEKAGYHGFKKVALKLVGDRKISAATLGTDWENEITFAQTAVNNMGGIFQEDNGNLLTFVEGETKESLIEGQDYTVKYTNAKKVGTVTATFTGKGRYKGTLKKKYKIVPNADKRNFTIRWKNVTRENGALVIAYQKGGAVPDFVLLDQDSNVLKNKTDYTVKLKDNKAPDPDIMMSCEITGKGNYKGYAEIVPITVKNGDISQCTLSVPDKVYSTKANAWKSKVTVKDVNGKTLAAGKDYEKEVTYSYTNELSPKAGTIIDVTVKGMGYYANGGSSLTGSYRIIDQDKNISKLQIVIDNQEYTGKEVTLSKEDIHVYATKADKKAKKELPNAESCYEIVEYKNNIKAGTAKVTLHGIGDYGGTKTYSFKIQKRAYRTNRVKSIKLDNTKLNFSVVEKGEKTLTATITPKDASQRLTNPTIIWTTSNSNIATVKARAPVDKTDMENETNNSISVTADIIVQKAGTVKITAIAQDGNKKAVCTVKITVPALKEKGQTIRCKTGDTHRLTFDLSSDSEIDWTSFKFESSNLKVASVTENGLVTMNRFGMVTIKVTICSTVQQCYFIVERASDDELNDSSVLKYVQEPDCKNDTAAINALLQKAENNPATYDTVYIPAGTYNIDAASGAFGGIILRDNQNLIMADGAKLVAIPNNKEGSQVIWAFNRKNVTITGGQIVGERNGHKGNSGEWGHGIRITGCTNVYISNVEVSQCWGDGIYLGYDDNSKNYSNRVTIENCNLHHNRRNNLSITDATNITVNNCKFNNASGTDPQYGIDIEPNAGRTCSNVTISNSTFKGNAKGTIQILGQLNAHVKGVTITNCTGDKAPVIWEGFGGSVSGVTQKGNKW
ncbi:MAG: hypothetical protein HDR16_01230 [Lachnospiraceae bacterium]|nr:hypothetical protein [Lachnospiraceae bacterium]